MRLWIGPLMMLALVACGDDVDKDGIPVDEDCNDEDASVGLAPTWYQDSDGDGWGSDQTREACEQPSGYAARPGDCDDDRFQTNPMADETCNELDDDCDGDVDEGFDKSGWYTDADGDGFGDPEDEVPSCTGQGLVDDATDCDDAQAAVYPGATELCNGLDDDCDGMLDEADAADASSWYNDADGDGFGSEVSEVLSCESPGSSWVSDAGDCDDSASDVFPGAEERCNDRDDDCDGEVDGPDSVDAQSWYDDHDRDTYGDPDDITVDCDQPDGYVANALDCDDTDKSVNPDTVWYADADGDGYGDPDSTTASCEQPSGYEDDDRDCNDTDADVNPRADEYCDEIDNDCDGSIDDSSAVDADAWYADLDEDGFGNPYNTITACEQPAFFLADASDCDDADPDVNPDAIEYCNEIDDDCDGYVDTEDADVVSLTWYLDTDEDGWGDDAYTTADCWQPEGYVADGGDCDDTDEDVSPGATEVCDAGVDNDCDGLIDTADPSMSGDGTWYDDSDGDGYGDADLTTTSCTEPSGYVRNDDDCDPLDALVWNTCWSGARVFTTCGGTGASGPGQTDCDTDYAGTTLDGEVTVSSGIQEWTVPQDGTYVITCYGAQGASADTAYSGGMGAMIQGSFDLDEDDVLYIVVGQQGTVSGSNGGGGGGSFVVDEDENPLIIAGGGAGTRASVSQNGCDAQVGIYGGTGSGSGSTHTCAAKTSDDGYGGVVSSSSWGSGGGGFYGGGDSDYGTTSGGFAYVDGAQGGGDASYNAYGGFGCGGAGNGSSGGGGGGGYSGGDGGRLAGGGGSYNDGDDTSSTAGYQVGDGQVTIDIED